MPSDEPVSPALLQRALLRWETELTELGGRDDLLDLDPASPHVLDLLSAHPNGLAGFLAGRPTRLSTLFRADDALRQARTRARAVSMAAGRLQGTYGLPGAHLATGVLSWAGTQVGDVRAPVLLRPLTLVPSGAGAEVDFDLEPAERAALNPALVTLLREHGVEVDDSPVTDADHGVAARRVLERLSDELQRASFDGPVPRLSDRTLIGTFTGVGPALVAGLRAHAGDLAHNGVLQALLRRPDQAARPADDDRGRGDAAGGLSWRVDAATSQRRGAPAEGLATSRAVLLDPAQRAVLDAVRAGADVRVEAAPGSGVSTVAAALVSAAHSAGRRTLVVAPGLDELTTVHTLLSTDVSADVRRAQRARHKHARLHTVDPEWGFSRMQLLSRLCELDATPDGPGAQLGVDTLRALAGDRSRAAALLAEAEQAQAYTPMAVESPWAGAELADPAAGAEALATVERLLRTELPAARAVMDTVDDEVGLPQGLSLTEWMAHVEVLASVRGTLDLLIPQVYDKATQEMVLACAPAEFRAEHNVTMSLLERRRWRREASALVRPGLAAADLSESLRRARLEKDLWGRLGGEGDPVASSRLDEATAAVAAVRDSLERLEPVLAGAAVGGGLADLGADELQARLAALAATGADLTHLPARTRALRELDRLGLTPLVTELRAARRPVPVADALEIAWLRGVLGQLSDPPAPVAAGPEPRLDPRLLSMTSHLGLGRLEVGDYYDLVIVLDAHRVGLAEAMLAVARARQSVLIGDPAGLPPTGIDLGQDRATQEPTRMSVLAASAGRLPTVRLDRVHRQPRALAEAVAELSGSKAVRPSWTVASARGGELTLVPVAGSTVATGEGSGVPAREVENVVALVAEHARTRPDESLAVLTVTRAMALEVSDVLRQALRRSPELAAWLSSPGGGQFVVTDLRHAEDLCRDHVVLSLGVARDPHGRLPESYGVLDTEAGPQLLATGLARATRRVSVVSSLTPDDLDPVPDAAGGALIARLLRCVASGSDADGAPAGDEPAPAGSDDVPADPVLRRLVEQLRRSGQAVQLGDDPADGPDLVLDVAGARVAVLWDGEKDLPWRGDLAAALTDSGWLVRQVDVEDIVTSPLRAAAPLARRP